MRIRSSEDGRTPTKPVSPPALSVGSASAQLAKRFAAGDLTGFRRMVVRLMLTHTGISLAGVVVAQLWGRELLTLLFTAEDAAHADVFVTIMWATMAATSSGVMLTALIAAIGC